MCRPVLLALTLLLVRIETAASQGLTIPGTTSVPIVGGTGGLRAPEQSPIISGIEGRSPKVHLGPTGKPCVRVDGFANAQSINPNIYNHLIRATNSCSQRIKMQVCYYKTQHCVQIELGPYDHKDAALGIYPALKDFRFEYTEQF
jgi:hypothetical protein